MKKYFHASPKRYRVGKVLTPQKERFLLKNRRWAVFLTDSEIPHYTIFDEAVSENWFIYEVVPLGKVNYEPIWHELTCEMVEVVKCVGQAKGMVANKLKNFKPKANKSCPGSVVKRKKFRTR